MLQRFAFVNILCFYLSCRYIMEAACRHHDLNYVEDKWQKRCDVN